MVHLSTQTDGNGWCADYLGFSSDGRIVTVDWNGILTVEVIGPVLPMNVWTHIVTTYSFTNGLQLYINGTWFNKTASVPYAASGRINILTLGNPLRSVQFGSGGNCNSRSIVPDSYYGYMDEFRVYSRELNAIDINVLANP